MRFRLPNFPCINPVVDFDYDFQKDGEDENGNGVYDNDDDGRRHRFLKGGLEEDCGEEEEEIDVKAEKFIAKFYEQMKLQRQTSYLQYTEMLSRGAS